MTEAGRLCKIPVKVFMIIFTHFQVSVVIMSFLTNVYCDELLETCEEGDLNQVNLKIFSGVQGIFPFCQSFPGVRMFLALPNVRNRPHWYPKFRPNILRSLHQVMTSQPQNLQLLEDFQGELDADGVHFKIMDGVNFAHYLVDQASILISKPVPQVVLR